MVRSAEVTDWERTFCASMISRSKSGRFQPSPKQTAVMERLVHEFREKTMRQDADDVIDGSTGSAA